MDSNPQSGAVDDPAQAERTELPFGFNDVLTAELEAVSRRRSRYGNVDDVRDDLCGLAISGGGIRVATFAIGAIQSLAAGPKAASDGRTLSSDLKEPVGQTDGHTGVLGAFDYISTVSGGGFVGGWLTSWIHRSSKPEKQTDERESASSLAPGMTAVSAALRGSLSDGTRKNQLTEAPEVSYLRKFSNYLTPQVGLFSADTWTLAAIYTRNFLLNIINIVALALSVVVAIMLGIKLFDAFYVLDPDSQAPSLLNYSSWFAAMAFLGTYSFCRCLWNVGRAPRWLGGKNGIGALAKDGTSAMALTVMLFGLTALAAVPALAAREIVPSLLLSWIPVGDNMMLRLAILVAILHGLAGLVVIQKSTVTLGDGEVIPIPWPNRIWSTACAVFVGAIAGAVGGLVLGLIFFLPDWSPVEHPDLFVVLGPPAVLFTIVVGIAIEVGFLSRSSTTHEREWWAKLAAWLLICSTAWLSITAIAVYSSAAFDWMSGSMQLALGTGAFGISALAAKFGSSSATKHGGSNPLVGLLVRVGPALFVLAIAIGMSAFVRWVVLEKAPDDKSAFADRVADAKAEQRRDIGPWEVSEEETVGSGTMTPAARRLSLRRSHTVYPRIFTRGVRQTRQSIEETSFGKLLAWMLIPFATALVLGARFDINMNSLNGAWANRIIRCYLGASNADRRAHQSTGFDEKDDLPLAELRDNRTKAPALAPLETKSFLKLVGALIHGLPLWRSPRNRAGARDYDGPYHLVNGALNVYRTEDLSRQERKAESFVMSPMYCGYTLANEAQDDEPGKYTPTVDYAGTLTLGSAMGISGAAASPNMGYHTMPSLAALMTIFNVRLGWWLPNPGVEKLSVLRSRGPRLGLRYLANELFSRTNAKTNYVYVSDGGHFENLATYELIRRRAKFIIVLDGEADPCYQFHGLGSLVRKCRVDFGVDIQISAHAIQPAGAKKMRDPQLKADVTLKERLAEVNYALGLIHYPKHGTQEPRVGLLIYVKSSLVAEDALHLADLRQYAETNKDFPHETTADQFFGESQFESYRLLGQVIMSRVLTEVLSGPETAPVSSDSSAEDDEQNSADWTQSLTPHSVKPLDTACLRDSDADGEDAQASDVAKQKQKLEQLLDDFRSHCRRFVRPLAE